MNNISNLSNANNATYVNNPTNTHSATTLTHLTNAHGAQQLIQRKSRPRPRKRPDKVAKRRLQANPKQNDILLLKANYTTITRQIRSY